ncbi:hypothetical protein [Streptomyces aureus]|uniref:Uncharacterized protein n=1 Tax=Streptomyces aureus TaxID=193461 RepID=A0ABV4SYX8_9ACTN
MATDAPCTVTNTATFTDAANQETVTANDPTIITGGDCNGGGGNGDGGSILPINLSGLFRFSPRFFGGFWSLSGTVVRP